MYKKNKLGFSLAELLISLLIVSIVLAATIPTITRRSGTSREYIWRWTNSNNDIYFGPGELQSAILGYANMPQNVTFFNEELDLSGEDKTVNADADKLIIVQQYDSDENLFQKSHISFYSAKKTADSTSYDGMGYSGRLVLDPYNIGLGIGALQSQENDINYNTAIGHYALFNNSAGESNTALGYSSLINLKSADSEENSGNTAIGAGACSGIASGSNNICIGNYSGYDPNDDTYSVTPVTDISSNISNRIFIGSHETDTDNDSGTITFNDDNNADIITGYTNRLEGSYDKELDINTRYFNIRTYDGAKSMFSFTANAGDDGYTANNDNNTYSGLADFNLYMDEKGTTGISVSADSSDYDGQIDLYTSFAQNGSTQPYIGTVDINDGALSYIFSDSSSSSGNYKVDINSDYELGITSLNSDLTLKTGTDTENNLIKLYNNTSSDSNSLDIISLGITNFSSAGILNISSESDININSDADITVDSKTLDINYSDSINIGNISIDSNDTIRGAADIYLTNLTISSGSVASAINQLQQMYQVNGGYSDIRLKDVSGSSTAGLKEINALEVKNFTFKDDTEKTPHTGVIAQDLQKVFPNSVKEDKESGYLRITTEEIFYAMVNSIKELCVQIQDLTAKILGLDKRIENLEKENEQLKKQNEDFEKRLAKLEKKLK